jgi:hypothetical protein
VRKEQCTHSTGITIQVKARNLSIGIDARTLEMRIDWYVVTPILEGRRDTDLYQIYLDIPRDLRQHKLDVYNLYWMLQDLITYEIASDIRKK